MSFVPKTAPQSAVPGAPEPQSQSAATEAAEPEAAPHSAATSITGRPSVSVVVPFAGDPAAARELLAALEALELRAGDELLLVDNSVDGALAASADGSVVAARARRSSYYARNVGARAAAGEWLLFVDADCRPVPALLDEFFAQPVPRGCGAIAGAVWPGDDDGLAGRYARARGFLDQAAFLAHPRGPFAATANLLVRRSAYDALGGFCEVRSGGDVDFCWRLREAGLAIGYRAEAAVEHRHRETLSDLLRQRARYGAGQHWLTRRHATHRPRARVARGMVRSLAQVVVSGARGREEVALFGLLDVLSLGAYAVGRVLDNSARPWPD